MNFIKIDTPDFHALRRKELLQKYPKEIRSLMTKSKTTFLWAFFITTLQLLISFYLQDASWLVVILLAYFLGAFLNHINYIFVHELSHDLVFQNPVFNRLAAMMCDLPLIFPSSQGFRKYHLMHHNELGVYSRDADLASENEVKIVGNSSFKKFLWMTCFGVIQGFRPARLKGVSFLNFWIALNFTIQLSFNVILFVFIGPKAFTYLLLSTIFALGIHTLGGRWIAEHYGNDPEQETYSYYGPLNKILFNIGHHVEHHDFMTVPWYNLPKLRQIAPDYYNSLKFHKSYSYVLYNFIFNKSLGAYSRVIRD